MRTLVVFCHPVETSFQAALHRQVLESLTKAGHQVDDLDLYAEEFQPALTRAERLGYHDQPANRLPVAGYVDRLMAAEALVLVYPAWNFGPPAMLKGWLDRVLLPGVSFTLSDQGRAQPGLTHIRKLAAVVTYGQRRLVAWAMGDPPRRLVTRFLRALAAKRASVKYYAHYDMNNSTPASRSAFLAKVGAAMEQF